MNTLLNDTTKIEDIQLMDVQDGRFDILIDGVSVEILVQNTHKLSHGRIFVLLSGARDPSKNPLPKFDRWKWVDKFPGITINISDPGLYSNDKKLRIGWYIGTKKKDYIETIAKVTKLIADKCNICSEKIYFYGSSAGGFAAISLASKIEGSCAIPINPQVNISNYSRNSYNSFIKNCFLNNENLECDDNEIRFDSARLFLNTKNSKVFFVQNILDDSHYDVHFKYFCKLTKTPIMGGLNEDNRVCAILFESKVGHGPEPISMVDDIIKNAVDFNENGYYKTPKTDLIYNPYYKSFYIVKDEDFSNIKENNDYISTVINGFNIRHTDKLNVNIHTFEETTAVIIGICIDTIEPEKQQKSICMKISTLANNNKEFLSYLDQLAGSYVLAIVKSNELTIYPDACSTFSVSYSDVTKNFVVSSHPDIVAKLIKSQVSDFSRKWCKHKAFNSGGAYYPGNLTEFDDVYQLTPNTSISSKGRIPSRFWPREKIGTLEYNSIKDYIFNAVKNQVEHLITRFNVNVSLSGGLDSRLTLAATKKYKDKVNYFTYSIRGNSYLKNDMSIATELCSEFGLKHTKIEVKTGDVIPQHILDGADTISPGNRAGSDLTWAYLNNLPRDTVHLRSNLMQIVRGYYLKNPANMNNAYTTRKISGLYRGGSRDEMIGVFEKFLRDTQFYKTASKGFHYTDLFYWEHRMGVFVSNVVRRERPIHDTIMLFNCRGILVRGLMLSVEDRVDAKLIWDLINDLWPELLEHPFSSGSSYFSSIRHI